MSDNSFSSTQYTVDGHRSPAADFLASTDLQGNTSPLLFSLGLKGRVERRQYLDSIGQDRATIHQGCPCRLGSQTLLAASSQLAAAGFGHLPALGELNSVLRLVVAEVKRDIGEGITFLGLFDQRIHNVAQVALVLGTVVVLRTCHADDVGLGVVPHADQLEECLTLGFGEVLGDQILRGKLYDYLGFSRVLFTHEGSVAEAEDVGVGGQGKWFSKLYDSRLVGAQANRRGLN